MPYVKKKDLKEIIKNAYIQGCIDGVALDHSEKSPEQLHYEFNVERWYDYYFTDNSIEKDDNPYSLI